METNERGNTIERSWLPTERYRWDFSEKFTAAGWEQYDTDQDAWYFGVWINKKLLQVQSYAEGDLTLVKCPDIAHFNAEIKSMNEFYGEGFVAKTIDMDGKRTTYCQDRTEFSIEVEDGQTAELPPR